MSDDKDRLFYRVLFESDRTCCICRDRSKPVKIHHIDGNHSNDERSNLAVVCDPCHTWTFTKIPFSRNLTPDLVRMYDKSWREICAMRLLPPTSAHEMEEYKREVLLDLTLACHAWKNNYIDLQPGILLTTPNSLGDVWDWLIDAGHHQESAEEWKKYRPLFDESINTAINTLQTILACHGGVISPDLKIIVIRTVRQLSVERKVFTFGPTAGDLKPRAEGVLRALAKLDRAAKIP
jgi:hypothetical protein